MKTKPRTKDQQRRFDAIKDIGCVPCRKMGYYDVPCDIQHVVEGSKRLGHDYTYGACPYHHRNVTDLDKDTAYKILGPSLAVNKREYEDTFGTERELVWEMDRLIKLWESNFV